MPFVTSQEDFRTAAPQHYYNVDVSIESELLFVPLKIAGVEYAFMLDTGSSVSMIDEKVLEENIKSFTQLNKAVQIRTAHDNSLSTQVIQVASLNMAQVTINDMQFAITDLDTVKDRLPENFAGILSLDQLPVSELVIDFSEEQLYLKF